MFARPLCPNLPDFVAFVRSQLNIAPALMPNPVTTPDFVKDSGAQQVVDSQGDPVWGALTNWLKIAFDVAMAIVNDDLAVTGSIYPLAVYNLGADILINIAPDVPGSGQRFMAKLREQYEILKPIAGAITTGSNEGSSATVLNPEFLKNLTQAQLQNLKTPWGRAYLGYANAVGTLWGLT